MWEKSHPNGLRVAVLRSPFDRDPFFEIAEYVGLTLPVKVADVGRYEIYFTRPAARTP